MPNAKSTKVGGKQYATPSMSKFENVTGINNPEALSDEYFMGTTGSPDDQQDKPFGTTTP